MHGSQELESRIKPGSKLRQEDKNVRQMVQLVEGLPCRCQDLSSDSPAPSYKQAEWRMSLSQCWEDRQTDLWNSLASQPRQTGELQTRWERLGWKMKGRMTGKDTWYQFLAFTWRHTHLCLCSHYINKCTCIYTYTHGGTQHVCMCVSHQHPY